MATLEKILGTVGKKFQHALWSAVAAYSLLIPSTAKAQMPFYGSVENVVSLNTSSSDNEPELSCDKSKIYFARSENPEDLMQATASGQDFVNIEPIPGVNTPDNAEASPTVSCDQRKIIFTRWPKGSSPGTSADLWIGIWSDPDVSYIAVPINGLNDPNNYEGSPALFDNDMRLAFDRSCDCGENFRGIYEALWVGPNPEDYIQVRKWDEFDELGIGSAFLGGVSRDGLRALINCFNCSGGSGDWDLIYADRLDVNSIWTFRDSDGNIQYLNINTGALEIGGSFIPGTNDIYFSSNRTGTVGGTDIWRARSCGLDPMEVSPAGSPYPLQVSLDRINGNLIFSFADSEACDTTNNLYIGALVGFPNVTGFYCHLPATEYPLNPEMRMLTLPMGSRNEFYLITESTVRAEGSPGFDSSGNERGNIFNSCGPTP
ncbi:hypothetical protein HYS48_02975 [Candidatus Woesearchaeota archaeon]|nr:hypothetical protein [Candidatus Woesearchaeota archaeon]